MLAEPLLLCSRQPGRQAPRRVRIQKRVEWGGERAASTRQRSATVRVGPIATIDAAYRSPTSAGLVRRNGDVPQYTAAVGAPRVSGAAVLAFESLFSSAKGGGDRAGHVVTSVLAVRILAGKEKQSRRARHHDRPDVGRFDEGAPSAALLDLELQGAELRRDAEEPRSFVFLSAALGEPVRPFALAPPPAEPGPG